MNIERTLDQIARWYTYQRRLFGDKWDRRFRDFLVGRLRQSLSMYIDGRVVRASLRFEGSHSSSVNLTIEQIQVGLSMLSADYIDTCNPTIQRPITLRILAVLQGLILHELGHLRYTDRTSLDIAAEGGYAAEFNLVEDVYVHCQLPRVLPWQTDVLDACTGILDWEGRLPWDAPDSLFRSVSLIAASRNPVVRQRVIQGEWFGRYVAEADNDDGYARFRLAEALYRELLDRYSASADSVSEQIGDTGIMVTSQDADGESADGESAESESAEASADGESAEAFADGESAESKLAEIAELARYLNQRFADLEEKITWDRINPVRVYSAQAAEVSLTSYKSARHDDLDLGDDWVRAIRKLMLRDVRAAENARRGSQLVPTQLARLAAFDRRARPYRRGTGLTRVKPYAVVVLLDKSGSTQSLVYGGRPLARWIEAAGRSLYNALRAAGVPVLVMGHTSQGERRMIWPTIITVGSFRGPYPEPLNGDWERLGNIDHEENLDGIVIDYIMRNMYPPSATRRILLHVSDGVPAGGRQYPHGPTTREHTRQVVQSWRERGAAIIAVSATRVVHGENSRIYGKQFSARGWNPVVFGEDVRAAVNQILEG